MIRRDDFPRFANVRNGGNLPQQQNCGLIYLLIIGLAFMLCAALIAVDPIARFAKMNFKNGGHNHGAGE